MENTSYAQKLALSKSVQGIVRALGIFTKTHAGLSCVKIENHEDGALVDFGTRSVEGADAHDEFAYTLGQVDRLIYLEQSIELLREVGADPIHADKMAEEANLIVARLYPHLIDKKSSINKGDD